VTGVQTCALPISAAAVLAVAIGFTRIYLHVHLWSDVAAGWGLGVGVFGLLAAVGMIVDYIRHNDAERAHQSAARAQR